MFNGIESKVDILIYIVKYLNILFFALFILNIVVCMYMFMRAYVYTSTSIHVYICVWMCLHVHVSVCLFRQI